MTILAFDTSSVQTGWSVFIDGEYHNSGIIQLKKIKDVNSRIREMISRIKDLIAYYSPTHVVIEDLVVERNWYTFKVLSMIIGAVLGICIDYNIPFNSLSPSEWRNIISSEKKPRKREELKKWDIQKVQELLNIKNINDDEADAILIGVAFCRLNNNTN